MSDKHTSIPFPKMLHGLTSLALTMQGSGIYKRL